ncbi:MAG TPA: SxtJ family membrane protein [Candidatus Methanoperedens sp.]|nr:SxtJ family membrane protein [Candidatus Methanoperedens sp.]
MRKDISRETVLETIGVLALACLVAGHLLRHRPLAGRGFLAAATLLLALGLFVKPAARAIAGGWLKFAELLGAVNSRILLGAIFYLFLTPLALLARLFRSDFLHLKKRAGADRSYWQARDHAYNAADLTKLW